MAACRWKEWEGDVLPPYVAFEELRKVPAFTIRASGRLPVPFFEPVAAAAPGIQFVPID